MSKEQPIFKLTSHESFTLEIGEQRFAGFSIESRWEGMTKYTDGKEWFIAIDISAARLIDKLFGVDQGGGWVPVLASPKIVSALKLAKGVKVGR